LKGNNSNADKNADICMKYNYIIEISFFFFFLNETPLRYSVARVIKDSLLIPNG